jgi:hypothetical protein
LDWAPSGAWALELSLWLLFLARLARRGGNGPRFSLPPIVCARFVTLPGLLKGTPRLSFLSRLLGGLRGTWRGDGPRVENALDTICEDVPGAEAASYVEALLPALVFLAFPLTLLLRTAIVLQGVVLVVVEVDAQGIPHPAGNLAPRTLPIIGSGSLASSSHAGLRAGEEA